MSSRTLWACVALAAGAGLAAMYVPQGRTRLLARRKEAEMDSRVDDALDDSFPASDPPSFSAPASTQAGTTPR